MKEIAKENKEGTIVNEKGVASLLSQQKSGNDSKTFTASLFKYLIIICKSCFIVFIIKLKQLKTILISLH